MLSEIKLYITPEHRTIVLCAKVSSLERLSFLYVCFGITQFHSKHCKQNNEYIRHNRQMKALDKNSNKGILISKI
jgi:hypothetical protein